MDVEKLILELTLFLKCPVVTYRDEEQVESEQKKFADRSI